MDGEPPTARRPWAHLVTPAGRGAVATLVVRGPVELVERAGFRTATGRLLAGCPIDRVVFGHWGDPPEDVVVCRTSATTVEVHCHGGRTASKRIEGDLRDAGVEWVERAAAAAQSESRLETELRRTLTAATTLRTAKIALEQSNGRLRRALEALRDSLGNGDLDAARRRVDELLKWSNVGRHLASPWRVVLTGRPNVGKSSLVNALLGYGRSIVFDQPGTTRDVVSADTAFDGWPVRLSDTAGLRDESDELESAGIERARAALHDADCRLILLDVSQPADDEDRRLLADWPEAIVVAHKSDLPGVRADLPATALRVSSVTGEGVDELAAAIVASLVPSVPPGDAPIPVSQALIDSLLAIRARAENDVPGAIAELDAWLDSRPG